MAKFLFATFLFTLSFKLLADFSLPGRTDYFVQPVQDMDSENQEETVFTFTFHFVNLIYKPSFQLTLTSGLRSCNPARGFTNSSFTPPEARV